MTNWKSWKVTVNWLIQSTLNHKRKSVLLSYHIKSTLRVLIWLLKGYMVIYSIVLQTTDQQSSRWLTWCTLPDITVVGWWSLSVVVFPLPGYCAVMSLCGCTTMLLYWALLCCSVVALLCCSIVAIVVCCYVAPLCVAMLCVAALLCYYVTMLQGCNVTMLQSCGVARLLCCCVALCCYVALLLQLLCVAML